MMRYGVYGCMIDGVLRCWSAGDVYNADKGGFSDFANAGSDILIREELAVSFNLRKGDYKLMLHEVAEKRLVPRGDCAELNIVSSCVPFI